MKFNQIYLLTAIGSESPKAAERKHLILSKVPRSRSYRILKNLNDSRTLRILGRDHANAILSGVNSANARKNSKTMSLGKNAPNNNIHYHSLRFSLFNFEIITFILIFKLLNIQINHTMC